jgi:hypothetical protein
MKLPSVATTTLAVLALACAHALPGCTYRLDGKVVDGFSGANVGRADDPDARKSGIEGASIELVREPDTPNRAVAARATSDSGGRFTLEVDGFGAGWMEEKWLLRVRRPGFETVETDVQLPRDPKGRLALVTLARGKSRPFREPENSRRLIDEARSYDAGIGGSLR